MPRTAASIALSLALLTGLVVGLLGDLSASQPLVIPAADPATARTAIDFYKAVDLLFKTGDGRDLRRLLHKDFVNHAGRDGTSASFVQDLMGLRKVFPDLRLSAFDAIAGGEIALVNLAIEGTGSGQFLGLPVRGMDAFANPEMLRIENGQVIERWGRPNPPSRFEPYSTVSVPLNTLTGVSPQLVRWTFDPQAEDRANRHGGLLLIIESSQFSVVIGHQENGRTTINRHRLDGRNDSIAVEPDVSTALQPGDALILPTDTPYKLLNTGGESANLIALELPRPTAVAWIDRLPAPGVHRELVAGGIFLSSDAGPYVVTLGKATLAPGSELSRHLVSGSDLLAVVQGTVEATVYTPGEYLKTPGGHTGDLDSRAELKSGTGAAAESGMEIAYRSTGNKPAVAWFVVFSPETAADPSTSD